MAGFRLTTKVQVSGWRFLLRRVEHAVVRRDTRMFDDPLAFYSRSVGVGILLAVVVCLGAGLLAYFKPLGRRSGDNLLVDRTTNQLYVVMPGTGELHPVYNLTSARLVLGNSGNPSAVKSQELNQMPKGQRIGIPGAPYATPVASDAVSSWALCDTVANPASVAPTVESSVIARPLALDASMGPMQANQALLATYQGKEWVITKSGRHIVDLMDRAVASSVGIPVTAKPTPVSEGVYNAVPDVGPWQLPPVPATGTPNSIGLPPNLVVGSVFQTQSEGGPQAYVVLPDGVARVNATTAAALRATNSYGLISPPMVESSVVAKIAERVYTSPLPDEPLTIVARQDSPTLCWSWEREPGDQAPKTAVLSGRHLPLPPAAMNTGIKQIEGSATVYIDGGKFVQLQSPDPKHGEALYYIDPQGVRYGIPDQQTAKTLGLITPQNAPWAIVRLLVDGPVLSKSAALLAHDTLPPDPKPRKLDVGEGS
jgi:type VII secretion protein EccB